MNVEIKRAYEAPQPEDGFRILVDRLWPRGVKKADLHLDAWAKEIAPSTELRKWFGHDPERWTEFHSRYRNELKSPAARLKIAQIIHAAHSFPTITLVYGAKDTEHNEAIVLQGLFKRLVSHK